MQRPRAVTVAFILAIATILAGTDGLHAQATRGGPPLAGGSRAAPLHRTSDFTWLAGSWEGRLVGVDNIVTELTFQPPRGGLMSGLMRLSQDGKPVLLELISLVDGSNGVELRFRHFNGALSEMESTFKQTMLLTTLTDSSDTFENTVAFDRTLLSTRPRVSSWTQRGQNAMFAHSDILDENGKPSTIEVVYRRTTPHS